MKNFVYHTPTRVYFGKKEEEQVGAYIKKYNAKKVLIHYGSKSAVESGLIKRVCSCLEKEGIDYVLLGGVVPNPELSLVRKGIKLCIEEGVDFVLAVGGGSVIDSAKDIANGAANSSDDVWEYSLKLKAPRKTLPKGAILTLAAAGSEMSSSCVITNEQTGQKRGYNSDFNRMDFAIENPELTYTVSPYQTACGAVDISMHTIERYFCKGEGTYLTDSIAEAVIKSTLKAGRDSIENPTDYTARANMMWASSVAHNDLTHCGRDYLLVVHQLEHEISGMYPQVAHGAGLAALWCSWARYVYRASKERFLQYVQNVWDVDASGKSIDEAILEGILKQENYYKLIGMRTSLGELGVKYEDLGLLANNCTNNKTGNLPG